MATHDTIELESTLETVVGALNQSAENLELLEARQSVDRQAQVIAQMNDENENLRDRTAQQDVIIAALVWRIRQLQ